jgi:hypothetical protein
MLRETSSEEWRDVAGWEGEYLISSLGRVYSVPRRIEWSGTTRRVGGHILKLLQNPAGYYCVGLCRDGRRHNAFIHRMVAEAFLGPSPFDGAFCCHGDGNAKNNRIENLRWDTPSENSLDSVRHGTHGSSRRFQCPQRHPLEAPNLDEHCLSIGKRRCRACGMAATWACKRRTRGINTTDAERVAYADECYDRILADDLAETLTEEDLRNFIRDHLVADVACCPRGHCRFEENVRKATKGCISCNRAFADVSQLRRKGLQGDLQKISDRHYRRIVASVIIKGHVR